MNSIGVHEIIIIMVMLALLAIPVLILAGLIWFFFFRENGESGDKKLGE